MPKLLNPSPLDNSYQTVTYFWLESLERIAQRYALNYAEIDVVARLLGNYTFIASFTENAKAFDYARLNLGESNALRKFSRWSLANSKSELSSSGYLICHRLAARGILTTSAFESEEYYELSQSVIDWLRYSAWETEQSLH